MNQTLRPPGKSVQPRAVPGYPGPSTGRPQIKLDEMLVPTALNGISEIDVE
jgi:hypothetical protein